MVAKSEKGAGYHLDLAIVGIGIGINSILGLPWVVAATVESLSHVRSLFVESTCTAPGERPKFFGVREQRVTGIFVFIMVGNTVFLGKFFKLFERIKILFMPVKHQPDRVYLRKVRISRIHIFTGIQVMCLVVLWVIKNTPAAISFPLMVLALVAVRKLMEKIFTRHELEVLDDVMPESMKKKIEEANEMEEDSVQLIEEPPPLVYNDSGINISEEVKNCTIWKSMEGNQQQNGKSSDTSRGHKSPKHKRKHKHKHKHKHHRHHGDEYERKLSTVTDKPDLETLANEDDTDSQTIPLVTLTTVDEREMKEHATTETTMNQEDDGDPNAKDTKSLRPVSV